MKEQYRVFHYNNGFSFRLEGIVSDIGDQKGNLQFVLTSGETVFVPTGWIATSFKAAPTVPPFVPEHTELQSASEVSNANLN